MSRIAERPNWRSIFSIQLLDIGNGKIPVGSMSGYKTFPINFCHFTETQTKLIEKVFLNIAQNYKNHVWLRERVILAAKIVDVNEMIFQIQNKIVGKLITYKSIDSVTNQDYVVRYPMEFLSSLEFPPIPLHNLQLKIGSVIIMLRLHGVKKLMNNVIQATILNERYKGEYILITLIPNDMPFEFKRLQFPVRLSFAISINKSQGQSLSVCGINLENPCFSHGQLYIACSHVGIPTKLFIYAPEKKLRMLYHKALE